MKKLAALFVLLASIATLASARAADIKPLDLGKGVDVWFSEDHTVPIVSFNITLSGWCRL